MENKILLAVVALALAGAAFALAYVTARAIYRGAMIFLHWALEQGFVGLAVFAACWFFVLPLTLIACAVVGFGVLLAEREERQAEALRREIPLTRQRLGLDPQPLGSRDTRTGTAHMIREPADFWKARRAQHESTPSQNS